MQQQINYAAWVGLSLAIFLGLLVISNFADKRETKSLSVQQTYDELALALDAAGIIPGADEGEVLSGFVGLTLDKSKLGQPSPGASGTMELKLGTVVTAKFGDTGAILIELRPEAYKQLMPGKLRQALKKISRIPYSKQMMEIVGAPTASFTVSVNPSGTSYIISPGFNNQQCTHLVIY